ncbi:multiple epidermal growth factor-like domains protein 10 [Drosophila innubila]|uniref:multiple epidermal growth factor-like domains protein 10 n=1 Tax=Drosophila innubila TaxID=198719 RepID=UPI00148C513E|nr:multiple epidermal growth factor-like domains protein 10 [Drosophila innubila]
MLLTFEGFGQLSSGRLLPAHFSCRVNLNLNTSVQFSSVRFSFKRAVGEMKQERISGCLCVWLWLWLGLLGSSMALREHYCERNVTVSRVVPVTKQRTIVKQPSKWTPWKKTKQITETYSTQEEQISYRLVSECCPGYLQMESGLCEPICDRGCPAFASCVAPQRCQCTAGYVSALDHREGSHYCEPICERSCPTGSECVAPNTCACRDGYKAKQPTGDAVSAPCEPTCQLGDGCANGQCVDVERCVCNEGFSWSMLSHSCESLSEDEVSRIEEIQQSTMTAISETAETATVAADCPEGFVLYVGECRAELFESNESTSKDCRKTGCGPHQTCNELGNCSCNAGYLEDEKKEESSMLSCHRSLLGDILSIDQAADDEDELNMFTIPILGVASGMLFVLLIAGLITRLRRGRGGDRNDDSQPKEAVLQCEFTQKSYDVDEWVP